MKQIPSQNTRIESGPIQFGDDWPGVFFRGDHALAMSFYLGSIIERVVKQEPLDTLSIMVLKGLASDMESCRVKPRIVEEKP